jgi:adenosylcobyric acid synthase
VKGGLLVCGTTSDAGKSFVVAGLCRLLARRGLKVAPFKAQNMALNSSVTADGCEIGHAQWIQAVAAGVEPEAAMNPILLKPTGERTSQMIVLGKPAGVLSTSAYHETKDELTLTVLGALADLRSRFDVVVCEGAGSPAEINLLDHDLVNLPLADAAGLPAIVVGDIDRGGVFASLYGTVALLPDHLRARVEAFVVNKLRGDPALLDGAFDDLERRCGVPTLGVLPHMPGLDLDAEDSLALDRVDPEPPEDIDGDVLDVAVVRWPRVENAGDIDPLRLEPGVRVRWVRSAADLGRPDLVVLPGSKSTRADLAWFRRTGLADAVEYADATVVAVCAGLQMAGGPIDDPEGIEGPPGFDKGMDWLPITTTFEPTKVLDRPAGSAVAGPGAGHRVDGFRIYHGRVSADGDATPWLMSDAGEVLGWHAGWLSGTTLHGVFEDDGFRSALLLRAARRTGKHWVPGEVGFAAARQSRLDAIADLIEEHVDMDRLDRIIAKGAP